MRKAKVVLALGYVFVFVFLFYSSLHSNLIVIGHWDCVEITITYATYNPDDNSWYPGNTETYYECTYIIYDIVFDGGEEDSGSDSGGTGDNPGSGGSTVVPGSGQPNDYDKNNDGIIDCYKYVIMRIDGLNISNSCSDTHKAWDVSSPGESDYGATIYAAASGEVIYVGKQTKLDKITGEKIITGFGYYVKIRDNAGNIWVYAHLLGTDDDPSGIGLTEGTKVTAGITPIGLCDNTGTSYGSHLHMEIWKNGVYGDKICPGDLIGNC